jgi:hypothetical protein
MFKTGQIVRIDAERAFDTYANVIGIDDEQTTLALIVNGEQQTFSVSEVHALSKGEHEQMIDMLADELNAIAGFIDADAARTQVIEAIAVAGVPENGAGMAAEHEWSDRQIALLEASWRT